MQVMQLRKCLENRAELFGRSGNGHAFSTSNQPIAAVAAKLVHIGIGGKTVEDGEALQMALGPAAIGSQHRLPVAKAQRDIQRRMLVALESPFGLPVIMPALDVPTARREGAGELAKHRLGAADHLVSVARGHKRDSPPHASTTLISVFRCSTPGSPVGLKTLNATVRSCQS